MSAAKLYPGSRLDSYQADIRYNAQPSFLSCFYCGIGSCSATTGLPKLANVRAFLESCCWYLSPPARGCAGGISWILGVLYPSRLSPSSVGAKIEYGRLWPGRLFSRWAPCCSIVQIRLRRFDLAPARRTDHGDSPRRASSRGFVPVACAFAPHVLGGREGDLAQRVSASRRL